MELVHGLDQFFIGCRIAQAPAGHRVGLGETVQGDGAFLHARQGSDAEGFRSIIAQPFIDFIRDDHDVILDGDVGQFFQHLFGQDPAGGIAGGDQDQGFGLGGDLTADFVQVQLVVIFFFQGIENGDGTQQFGDVFIIQPARVGHQDFVPFVQDGFHSAEYGFGEADGDQDFFRLVVDAVLDFQLIGDGFPQFHGAEVGGIENIPGLDILDAGVFDVGGCIEIRAAQFEVDHRFAGPFHGQCFFIDLTDAGRFQFVHSCSNEIFHKQTPFSNTVSLQRLKDFSLWI